MEKNIYLDNAATTQVYPEVVEAMTPYFTTYYGNPSSIYTFAGEAKKAVDHARALLADGIHAKTEEIYFTGGGSESDNWALKAVADAYSDKGKHIITTKIEHHAILHTCEYLEKEAADGVNVPAGVFTGTKLFSGFGKKVNFKLIKIISAKCEIISSFESAGINQVKHSVYVNLIPDVTLVAVGRKRHSLAEVSVLLYENVIIGKVPKVYMGISSVGECGKTTEKR